jgi:hypothetical protein
MNRNVLLVVAAGLLICAQGYGQSAIRSEKEVVGQMQRNLGRIYGLSVINDSIVPKCFSSVEHGSFFRSYLKQFTLEMKPLIEGVKQINSVVLKNKYGVIFEHKLERVFQDSLAEIQEQMSQKISTIQNAAQLEIICASYRAQIKNGLFNVQPYAELYLEDLKSVSSNDYDVALRISAAMKNAEAGLRKLAAD